MRFNQDNSDRAAPSSVRGAWHRSRGMCIGLAAAAAGVIVGGSLAIVTSAGALSSGPGGAENASDQHLGYRFTTLDNSADPTFNQLLGINDRGTIAGYFGSGAAGHPNQGYLLRHQGGYISENYPGSVQTQVTGLNNSGVTVGFFSDQNNASQVNDNFGFVDRDGRFTQVNFPTGDNAAPPVNQLLGVNDFGVAVGFYTDAQGINHGYEYHIHSRQFTTVQAPGGGGLTAAAISDSGKIAGFYSAPSGTTDAFVTDGRRFTDLAYPGASQTMALGVNDSGEVVGAYTMGTGNSAQTHGFTWTSRGGFVTVDDPNGIGTTTVNGVNDHGALVGFYTDSSGNTDGFLASQAMMPGPGPTPTSMPTSSASPTPAPMPSPAPSSSQGMGGGQHSVTVSLQQMPAGTVSLSQGGQGLNAQVNVSGLTPGSSHAIELRNGGTVLTQFTTLTADGTGQASTTLTSNYTGSIPAGSRVVVLNGAADDGGTDSQQIAGTFVGGSDNGLSPGHLQAVDITGDGTDYQTLTGTATVTYDPAAQTLTVTVNASGLTPGAHAAHIHIGSCASQGAVQYMLMDLTANSQGQVMNETRVVTGVTSPIPATGMYLNIHQGDSNTILANGQPTIAFRPLLCANI